MQGKYKHYISGTCALDMNKLRAHQRCNARKSNAQPMPATYTNQGHVSAKLIKVDFQSKAKNESSRFETSCAHNKKLRFRSVFDSCIYQARKLRQCLQANLDYKHPHAFQTQIARKELSYLLVVGSLVSALFVWLELQF